MKTYLVQIVNSFGADDVRVRADRWERTVGSVLFYQADKVVAAYSAGMVQSVKEEGV